MADPTILELQQRVEAIETRQAREDEGQRKAPHLALSFLILAGVFDLPSETDDRIAKTLAQSRVGFETLRDLVRSGWRPGQKVPQEIIDPLAVDDPLYLLLQAHTA
jgi:hypothetical protein